MSLVFEIIAALLFVFWILLLVRLVFDLVQAFSRDWRPGGPLLVLLEALYTVTDPPLKAIRRVVPPLRLGQVQLDLAFLILFIGTNILMGVARTLAVTTAS